MYDFRIAIKTAWRDRDVYQCVYWDNEDREIEVISPSRYRLLATNEIIRAKQSTEIYGRYVIDD